MATEGRNILVVVVELCSLTFRHGDNSKSNIIASALFGDGAAALLLRGDSECRGTDPAVGASGSHTWPGSLDIMGWNVEDDGLGVMFSRDIPTLVPRDLRAATDRFLAGHNLSRSLLAGYICHPGGSKVIAALEDAFELPAGRLDDARAVLRSYGNMSAATVLFVLARRIARGLCGRWLMTALGPGFTAGFQLLEA
jgi:alkylresorcinol/alkylpyrone synthase